MGEGIMKAGAKDFLYAPHRKTLSGKRLNNCSPGGFETDSKGKQCRIILMLIDEVYTNLNGIQIFIRKGRGRSLECGQPGQFSTK